MDWTVISSLGTAVGTLVLAAATFAAVRSANRSARATERALMAGLLPMLIPSRTTDPHEKIRFADDHWVLVEGGHAVLEQGEHAIYLALALRNLGQGVAVLDCWDIHTDATGDAPRDPATFRRLTRDIYVPAGDAGFWQGALRDESDPVFHLVAAAITHHQTMSVDLLYRDLEGGQRTISRFAVTPRGDDEWLTTVFRHWRLDQPDARR